MKNKILSSVISVVGLCMVIFMVSAFFVAQEKFIGLVLLFLSAVCLLPLIPLRISFRSIQPDIVFGVIDNGILALLALVGGKLAGVPGAIVGGVVGNAITDGLAGLFEGYSAEVLRKNNFNDQRTIAGSALGKMSGCLFGAGLVLTIAGLW